MNKYLTSGCTGQIFAVTFCAKTRTKTAIKNLLGEPGVSSPPINEGIGYD